jgi:ubiquinone/menaquinone biosynthesis C-methylase UbiE
MLTQAADRATEQGIANVSWVEAPAEKMPFPNATFDLATVRIAPHHFTDVPAFLSEARRVLKPSGMFLLGDTTVPGEDTDGGLEAGAWQNAVEKARDASHIANLSPKVWNELCASAGFSVTHLEYSGKAIRIPLEKWLETAGCSGDCAARVRALFADAPSSARHHFGIHTDADGETYFGWARVLLRATVPAAR